MTRPQAELRQALEELVKRYPVPSDIKLERRLARLERMRNFYAEKSPEAPEKQAAMFRGFVTALLYSMTMIKMHRKLTRLLAELTEVEK